MNNSYIVNINYSDHLSALLEFSQMVVAPGIPPTLNGLMET